LSEFNALAVDETNTLYRFMGSHWVEISLEDIKLFISTNFRNLDIVRRNSDVKGIAELVHVHAERGLSGGDLKGVNFANGFLSEDGVLLPHAKEFGCTYVLPYPYRPELAGKMPLFIKFLDDCWGHTADFAERVKALQQAVCCTLLGFAPRFQRAFLVYGVARSGKSVMLEIISNLMPSEARAALSPQQWKDNFQVVGLNNKLVNIVGELSERHTIDGHTFKEVIDGSAMSVRRLYGEPFVMHCKAAHWAGSNHFPRTTDSSEGFNRRWLVFHFDRAVPIEKVQVNLAKRLLAEEREAIVAWALDCIKELATASTLHLPPSHKEIVNQISCFNNPVRYFLQECKQVKYVSGKTTNETALYSTFIRFAAQFMGLKRPLDGRDFRQKMDELGSEFGYTRYVDVYNGISIPEGIGS
jgi:putative DNA primase/helicase